MSLRNYNLRVILPIHPDFTRDNHWLAAVEFCHKGNHELAYLVLKHLDDDVSFYEEVNEHADLVFNIEFSGHSDGLQQYYDNTFETIYRSQTYQLGLSNFYEAHRAMYLNLIGGYVFAHHKGERRALAPTRLVMHRVGAIVVDF